MCPCPQYERYDRLPCRRFITRKDDVDLWEDCCAVLVAPVPHRTTLSRFVTATVFYRRSRTSRGSGKLGSLTLPMSSGNTDRQIQFMTDLGSTVLCALHAFPIRRLSWRVDHGKRPSVRTLSLKPAYSEPKPGRRKCGMISNKSSGLKHDIYGLTEISGPGVSFECEEQKGMHINEDHFIGNH